MKYTIPIEIIELEKDSYHIMVIAVLIKNIKINIIIDTGASKTVFDFEFVQDFIADIEKPNEQNSSGINAAISETHIGTIPELQIGKFIIYDFQTVLLDLSHINSLYENFTDKMINGLIGSDFLVKYSAVVDYKNRALILEKE